MLGKYLIILFYFFSELCCQHLRVLDGSNYKPLENVNIFVKNTGTTTDRNGQCDLRIFHDTDIISFQLIGYENITLLKSNISNILFMKKELIPGDIVNVFGKGKYSKKYKRLERDVRRVYPYVKIISSLLISYDGILDSVNQLSLINKYFEKRKIFQNIENKLIDEYGYSVRKLSKNQGRILIKLIDRETDRSSYGIIREFRSLLHAGFWQFTAKIFGHNLKAKYDIKKKEEQIIEIIIKKIKFEQGPP